jgi:uncharacterized protein YndB with AHSA1/START domain
MKHETMYSFELKIPVKAEPTRVFDVLTNPAWITEWDTCVWAHNDMCLGGKLRKRDEEGELYEGEIVLWDPPTRFGTTWQFQIDIEEPEQGRCVARMDFRIEGMANGTMLHMRAEGFPTEDLAEREQNNWGGWFLEKIKKVSEK